MRLQFKVHSWLLALCAIFSWHCPTNGARILAVFPFQAKSHYNVYEPLLKNLASRGHEVVSISHFPQKSKLSNFIDVDVSPRLPPLIGNLPVSAFHNFTVWTNLVYLTMYGGVGICDPVLRSEEVRDVIESGRGNFDMLIIEIFATDCFLALAHEMKIPNVVGAITGVPLPWSNDIVGNPDHPAYVPNWFSSYTDRMTMMQRAKNMFLLLVTKYGYRWWSDKKSFAIARSHFGNDLPNLDSLRSRIGLILTNGHLSISTPRPMSPAMKEVGGLHIPASGPPPLKKELQDYLDARSEHGVIYFSLGSQVDTSTLTEQQFSALLSAFEALPQQILWRCNTETMPALPKNVECIEWAPQFSILCHPNVRLFITHGGLLGTQEAIYCGVPILGMPLFGDQFLNMASYVEKGFALQLDFKQLSQERVFRSLNELLTNEGYRKMAEKTSERFKDRPIPPLNEATYWVEYILRHGPDSLKGAASELSWYQHLFLDVLLVPLIVIFIVYTCSRSSNHHRRNYHQRRRQ